MIKAYTNCLIEYTVSIISNKWKVLTQNLKDLKNDEIPLRKLYLVVPLKVENSLTEKGKELKGILELMKEFGINTRIKNEKREIVVRNNPIFN